MDLAAVHQLCLGEIRSNIAFLTAGLPVRDSAGNIEELSRLFQGLAICHLLESLDHGQFRENLVRSGHARRYFLRSSLEQGNVTSKYLALSRTEALLDTLVAGDLKLARSIAELSPTEWNPDWEYEDDFCFYNFLQQSILQASRDDMAKTLVRFEAALEGGSSSRLRVLKTLLYNDTDGFEAALTALIEEEQKRMDGTRSSVVDSKFLFWPRSFVSIEGLALQRTAELSGLSITREFQMCPADARLTVVENNYRDLFAELDALLAG